MIPRSEPGQSGRSSTDGIGPVAEVLDIRELHKHFAVKSADPVEALRGVSLRVQRGEIVGLVGPDGAGKTTLMRMAAGLLVPDKGKVLVLGLDSVRDSLRIQGRIAYMPQKFGLYQDLTCQENLDLYADLQGVDPSKRKQRYARLLEMTQLAPFAGRLAGRLSGGMKQKLGLACALVKSPELLLLDEPTVGVDPISRRELWRIVHEMVAQEGIGVLVATSYLDEAEKCRRIVVLHEGRMLDEGVPEVFRQRMRGHTFVLRVAEGARPRSIHARLVGQPGIIDATIRSGRVRVVTSEPDSAALTRAIPEPSQVEIHPTAPNFEDAFMKLLADVRTPGTHVHQATSTAGGSNLRGRKPDATDKQDETSQGVVHTRNLTKTFGAFTAVSHISFDVHRGEIFGLLGPNGAGKSTTFRMLCGLSRVSGGEVRVAGRDLRRSGSFARQRLGYMAQQFSLYGQHSVLENLRFFGRAYGLSRAELKERIGWALAEFDLTKYQHTAAGMLPGGFKQRLAMAAALLHRPDILFLDEPTSGVDPLARRDFWQRISSFAEGGVTVVVTTHFMEEAEYCDRMLIMSQGRELAHGTPDEIRTMARTEQHPDPTIEDAFIALAEHADRVAAKGAAS